MDWTSTVMGFYILGVYDLERVARTRWTHGGLTMDTRWTHDGHYDGHNDGHW